MDDTFANRLMNARKIRCMSQRELCNVLRGQISPTAINLSTNNLTDTISKAIELGTDTLFEMGQRCSQHIRDTYQYTEVAAKNKIVYEWIMGKGEKPKFVI